MSKDFFSVIGEELYKIKNSPFYRVGQSNACFIQDRKSKNKDRIQCNFRMILQGCSSLLEGKSSRKWINSTLNFTKRRSKLSSRSNSNS